MIPGCLGEWAQHAGIEFRAIAERTDRRVSRLIAERETGEASGFGKRIDTHRLKRDTGKRAVPERAGDEIIAADGRERGVAATGRGRIRLQRLFAALTTAAFCCATGMPATAIRSLPPEPIR
jgi:hypothetical protein